MCDWDADAKGSDLRVDRRIELDGAADLGCRWVFIDTERKRKVAVGGQVQAIGGDLSCQCRRERSLARPRFVKKRC